MKPTAEKRFRAISLVAAADILAICASFLAAYYFRFSWNALGLEGRTPAFLNYLGALLAVLPVYLYLFRSYGLYKTERHLRRIQEIFLVIKAVTVAVVVLMALTFFYRGFSYSRTYLVTLWLFSMVFISGTRYLLIQWEYQRKRKKHELTRVLVIGANRNTRTLVQWARRNPHYGHEVTAVLAKNQAAVGKHVEGVEIVGCSDQSESWIRKLKPDAVFLVDPAFSRQAITDLVEICEDELIEFKVATDFYGLLSRCVEVENITPVPLLGFRDLPLDDPWNRLLKRSFDFVVSLIMFIFCLPICIMAMIMVKTDDGGPCFYSQERVGRDGKVFKIYKFRTMRIDAEKETGPVWAKQNDSRRTRFGNFLRRFNIDELPQLWNVLTGEMSLIGPRPERPHFVTQFRATIPRYMARHKVKSGITGWAQANGLRGNTSIQERVKYDLYYMENWSLLFDIEILFMTLFAYKNAY